MARRPRNLLSSLCFLGTISLIALAATGCRILPKPQPDPTRFFVLSDPLANDTEPKSEGVTLGLLRPELPAYLAGNRTIAVSTLGQEVSFRQFDRWAEPLDAGISRVLQSSLTRAPGVKRVLTPPFASLTKRDFDLRIRVIDFAGLAPTAGTESIDCAIAFELLTPDGNLYATGVYTAPQPDWNGDSDTLARLLSQALLDTAAAIATKL